MALNIRALFNKRDVDRYITERVDRMFQLIYDELEYQGEQFIINGRSTRTYKDRTKNLRSSIGYIVMVNGKQKKGSFSQGTAIGRAKGKSAAIQRSLKYPKGITFIGVAGMEYAASVERKGYDVITNASIIAEQDIKKGVTALAIALKRR